MAADSLSAKSLVEAFLYFHITPCPICYTDRLEPGDPVPVEDRCEFDVVGVCRNCGGSESVRFAVPVLPPLLDRHDPVSGTQAINLGSNHSELIDLVQWVTLYEVLLERSSSAPDAGEGRWLKIRAGQCLAEALKFLDEHAAPRHDPVAFVESSRRALAEHPERYERHRLIELRSQLPTEDTRSEAIVGGLAKRPWWKFW